MSWIHDLARGLAAQKAQQARAWWRRSVVATGLLVFCSLTALSGLGFIAVGGYIALSETFTPWEAGLIVGGAILVLSLVGALIARFVVLRRKPAQPSGAQMPRPEEAYVDAITHLGETIGAGLFKNGIRTTDIVIAALVAGTVLGASPALRDRLLRRKGRSSAKSSTESDHKKP
jgi:hypothetical protein